MTQSKLSKTPKDGSGDLSVSVSSPHSSLTAPNSSPNSPAPSTSSTISNVTAPGDRQTHRESESPIRDAKDEKHLDVKEERKVGVKEKKIDVKEDKKFDMKVEKKSSVREEKREVTVTSTPVSTKTKSPQVTVSVPDTSSSHNTTTGMFVLFPFFYCIVSVWT